MATTKTKAHTSPVNAQSWCYTEK